MMMPLVWCVVLAAAPDAPVATVSSSTLTLGEVIASATSLYPAMAAARADVTAADGEALTAAGGFDPAVRGRVIGVPIGPYPQLRVESVLEVPTPLWGTTLFGGYRLGVGSIPDYYTERRTWSAGELRAGLAVPTLRNGPIDRRRAAQARAALGQQLAGFSADTQRIEVTRLAASRYWEWVAAGRRREVARSLLAIAQARDGQLAARVKAGDVASFDRQDNQRALVQRDAFVVQTQRGVEQAVFELSLFFRDDDATPVRVADARLPSFPEPDSTLGLELEVDAALARRPDVQRLAAQIEQQRVELRLQRNQLLPALDLGASVTADIGRPGSQDDVKLGQPELELNAVLDVPLLYRTGLGRIKTAEAQLARLTAQLQLQRDRVAVELRDAQSALNAARQRITFARNEVAVAKSLEEGERTRFQFGDSTLLIVNIREQQTAEAELREVDALLDFHRAAAAYRAAMALF